MSRTCTLRCNLPTALPTELCPGGIGIPFFFSRKVLLSFPLQLVKSFSLYIHLLPHTLYIHHNTYFTQTTIYKVRNPKKYLSISPLSLSLSLSHLHMAEKHQAEGYAPANGYSRSDEEASRASNRELRNKKRKKWAIYIIVFIIFQAGIIALFTMTVMKFRTPKFRMRSVNSLDTLNGQASSFSAKLTTQLGIKNTNFGPYKYRASNISFYYKDTQVGSAVIPKSKADFRRTKKVNVVVDLAVPPSLASNTEWESAISSGVLPLTSQSRLTGKIEIMFIFKKKRAVNLNCTVDLNITGKQLENISCK